MNFKLLTFIFVVIGVQSIDSSIINRSSIDNIVQISSFNAVSLENTFARIKSLTFNISDTVVHNGIKYPEIICHDQGNDFCSRGNGKYQAKIITCKNLLYGFGSSFECQLLNAKVLNKNVQYKGSHLIACLTPFSQETAKGLCRMEYWFESTDSYNEADDVENKSFSAISKSSIDNLVQITNSDVEATNLISPENPWADIKSLTFNISDTVEINGVKHPEVKCVNIDNDFCSRGNGKYQAKIVTCKNLMYGSGALFQCQLFNAKVLNRNVEFKGRRVIACLYPFSQETAKGKCRIKYAYASSDSYNEADDFENPDKI